MEKGSDLQTGGQVPGVCHLKGHRVLGHERKQAICSMPWLNTKQEVREFLRAAGFSSMCILGFSEIAKPLFKATAGSGKDPLEWGPEQEKASEEIKRLLTSTPALGLPDVTRDFNLFVGENNPTAAGPSHKQLGHGSVCHTSIQTTGSSGLISGHQLPLWFWSEKQMSLL